MSIRLLFIPDPPAPPPSSSVPIGAFDEQIAALGWFSQDAQAGGWFSSELVSINVTGGGGGSSFRALVIVAGQVRQILDAELGTLKPVVLLDGVVKERATTEGLPIIWDGSTFRTLGTGETLIN